MSFRHITLAFFLTGFPFCSGQDASMFRFGPAHEGVATGKGVVPGERAWRFRTGGKVRSTPAVKEGVVYFGSEDGHLYAIDLKDGREIWRFKTDSEIASSPALAEDRIFFLSRDGILRALDRHRGQEVWRLAMGPDALPRKGDYLGWDYWLSSPTVQNGTIYVGGGDGKVYAVDTDKGIIRWTFGTAQRVRSSPAVKDGMLFVGSFDGHVYALDATTGKELWKFNTQGGIQSSPAVADGTVFIGSRSAAVFALDAKTGSLKWRTAHPFGSWVLASPTVAKGKVIVGSSDEQFLHALDAQTGQEVWRLDTRYRVLGSPVVVGDVVLSPTEGAYVYAVDLETGLVLGMSGAEGAVHTSPVPTTGAILVGSDDNSMHAFRTLPAPARIPADETRLKACTGTFEIRPGSVFTLSQTGKGFLRLKPGGFPAALMTLGEDGVLRCPAYGLEFKTTCAGAGQPTNLFRVSAGKEMPLRRLP